MSSTNPARHILIDFENVPAVDLAPLAGAEVEITLLVGEKNKRLGIDLVEQLLAGGLRVHLIRVGASGRNALDLTLTFYLGKAVAASPRTEYFIISDDRDFDATIAHLQRTGLSVSRHPSVAALPFLTSAKSPARAPSKDLFAQFLTHLQAHPNNRPKRRSTLLSHIKTQFGNKPTDAEAEAVLERLRDLGHITLSDKGAVSYGF